MRESAPVNSGRGGHRRGGSRCRSAVAAEEIGEASLVLSSTVGGGADEGEVDLSGVEPGDAVAACDDSARVRGPLGHYVRRQRRMVEHRVPMSLHGTWTPGAVGVGAVVADAERLVDGPAGARPGSARSLPFTAFVLLSSLALLKLVPLRRCASSDYSPPCAPIEFRHHIAMNYLFAPWISWLLLLQSALFLRPDARSYHTL
uniref:Uncharacterized protein n=1 Tax=Oryza barthii TaxID=65489 RepID=A0A0D3HJY9_9ORYZ